MTFTRTALMSLAATLSIATAADAAWGLRFEVSKDGTTWAPSVNVIEGETAYFRMSSYFVAPITVSSTSNGQTVNGAGIAFFRFVGSSIAAGFVPGDKIVGVTRLSAQGGTQLLSVSGNVVGATSVLSFGARLLLPAQLAPLVSNPEQVYPIYSGKITIGPDATSRTITIKNNTFGASNTPGLQFFLDTADGKAGPPSALSGPRIDVNALINVNAGPCDPVTVNGVQVNSNGLLDTPIVIQADVSAAADRFLWYHNDVPLVEGGRFSGTTTKRLSISHPNALDSGAYTLRCRSNCESIFTDPQVVSIPCTADLNNDGFVNDADFGLFAAAYSSLSCPPGPCPADLNADGFVDDLDFLSFASQYNALLCVP